MKVTTERLDNCQVNVIVELDAAEVDKRLRQTARKISGQFTVPGYRRGRAPFHAVVRVFGREAIQQETLEEFGQEWYEEALEQIEYEPYAVGDLQEVEWEPFRMTILLPVVPEVDLGDYRSVRVPYEVEEITGERIDEYLEEERRKFAQWVPVERPAALGDQVVIDMKGAAGDRTVIDNEDYEMYLEEEATHPLPGFHEQVVGMSPGEEKTFTLPVPEDDEDEDSAGQEAVITVSLHSVKEEDLPPLDDELAMMIGDYDTLEDLKASVRERLETEALQKAESEYLDQVLEAMIEAAVKIEYPPQATDRETELALSQMERNLAGSGIQLDTFLGMIGKTREAYKQDLRPSAEERLRKRLALNEIARHEGLEASPEEVESEIDRVSELMGPQADQMRDMLETPEGRLSVTDDLIMEKVQALVVQIGKGEAPPREREAEPVEVEEEAGDEEESPGEAEPTAGIEKEEGGEPAQAEVEEAAVETPAEAGEQEPGEDAGADEVA